MHKSAPYRRLLLGSLLFIAVVALLVYGIGWETLKSRREDLIYLGQQHMFLWRAPCCCRCWSAFPAASC